jgi:hypothetical protein
MFLTHVSPALLLDVYGGFTTRCLWWLNQDDWKQVDRGVDNPHRNIITKPIRGAKARLGCSAIDDDEWLLPSNSESFVFLFAI